mgnify:FL=1|tara:strand:+ start:443 stop:838 length:396 start_codon:yes stop_codon:yes gene_type:complete
MKQPYSKADIRKLIEMDAIDGDGHTIMNKEFFIEKCGIEDLPKRLIVKHKSNPKEHKETIYVDGQPVTHLEGVYCLSFHYWIAGACGVTNFETYNGRGTQARAIAFAMYQWAHSDENDIFFNERTGESVKV